VEYHLTEPTRISLGEKTKLVGLVDELRREFPGVDVTYVGLLPRHV
jgi:hypothetical protein